MTVLDRPTQAPSAERLSQIAHPRARLSTIVSSGVIVGIAVLGVLSFINLDYSLRTLDTTWFNISRFLGMATPLQWPGWEVTGVRGPDGTVFTSEWVGVEPILKVGESIVTTLALVVAGTALAAVLSVPVAFGAARNTTPNPAVLALCRGIGVAARAIPDVALVVFLAFLWFGAGTLAAIVALGLHSVGMISKMMADAIEQIDEGPRLAVRATGASKIQQFWTGVVPQALPAWIAVTLHRADINLRGTVILGIVGVAGLGYDLNEALRAGPSGMRRVLPIVLIVILLCVLFEIVSSSLRARLLGVRPTGRGVGDAVVRAAARRSSAVAAVIDRPDVDPSGRNARLEAALHRPWTVDRIGTAAWIWLGIVVVVGAYLYTQPDVVRLVWGWRFDQVSNEELGRAVWPPNFGSRSVADVVAAVGTTLTVALAATLMAGLISAVVGPLAARNVAPNSWVRNLFRGVALVIRAIPDLVIAILFIIATGFGPQAAALALGIGGVGLLGKLIGDSMEEVPNGPERAVSAAGGNRIQVFFASTVPMSMPALVSHLMYLLEQNVRSATLLGIVGGGGIGFLLINALQGRNFDQVLAFLFVIIGMVVVIESASILIRRALR